MLFEQSFEIILGKYVIWEENGHGPWSISASCWGWEYIDEAGIILKMFLNFFYSIFINYNIYINACTLLIIGYGGPYANSRFCSNIYGEQGYLVKHR